MKKKNNKQKKHTVADSIVSLVLVLHNDEDILQERIKKINDELVKLDINYEILVVDNNSQDKTIELVRKLQKTIPFLRILILSKPYETEIALTAGLDSCIGDYAVLFNAYTDPPNILPTIVYKLMDNYDIIIGKTKKPVMQYGPLSRLFLWLLERLSTHNFTYRANYLIGLNRKAINSIIRTRRKSRNFSYINYLIGFRKYVLSYTPLQKYRYKYKKENFFVLFFNATDIIISNSYKPIRVLTFLGILASVLFLVYVLIISFIYFFINRAIAPQGWISLSFVLGTMFLLLFSLLTLISEYLIRTLHETRNEPLYFIADEIDKSVILPEQDRLNIV